MGCIPSDNKNYFEFDRDDIEKDIRNWEKSNGFFRNNFNSIYPLVQLDHRKTNKKGILNAVFVRNYSNQFLSILEHYYFKNREDYSYNMENINLLVLLSSIHIEIKPKVGNKNYCDKALYIFNYINRNDDMESGSPIEKNNYNLKDLIKQLVHISSTVLYECYNLVPNDHREGAFTKAEKFLDNITEYIVEKLFTKRNGEKLKLLSFDEFNDIFMRHPNVSYY